MTTNYIPKYCVSHHKRLSNFWNSDIWRRKFRIENFRKKNNRNYYKIISISVYRLAESKSIMRFYLKFVLAQFQTKIFYPKMFLISHPQFMNIWVIKYYFSNCQPHKPPIFGGNAYQCSDKCRFSGFSTGFTLLTQCMCCR